jgi:hypothetical protein
MICPFVPGMGDPFRWLIATVMGSSGRITVVAHDANATNTRITKNE